MNLRALIPIKRFRDPAPVVAVVRLVGPIMERGLVRSGLNLDALAPVLERAFKLKHLKAVALAVNSPGGSPVQSALIAGRIRELAQENAVPVVAFAEDAAASGGYWLACAADEIFADESSIVGSIGVIYASFGLKGALERLGVDRRLYTAGERKSLMDPYLDEKPEDVERLKALQAEIHESFKAMVRERRGDKLKAADDILFTGEFWTGKRALELGLIDSLGHLRPVMRKRYGDDVKLKRVDGQKSWRRKLFPFASEAPDDWAKSLLSAVEERLAWARFGL